MGLVETRGWLRQLRYVNRELQIIYVVCSITRWHGSASVLRTTTQVNGKVGNSTPAPSKTPEPIVT